MAFSQQESTNKSDFNKTIKNACTKNKIGKSECRKSFEVAKKIANATGKDVSFYGERVSPDRRLKSTNLKRSQIRTYAILLILLIALLGLTYGRSLLNSHNPFQRNASTSVETSHYSKSYYGLYDWENGIGTDWLYSGDVVTSSIAGHDSVVWLHGGGTHPTLLLTISNFVEYEPLNDSQTRTISMWIYPNNTQDVSIAVSPQLFMIFNATDSHLWYLDFMIVYGGAWVDTGFTYFNNTWIFLEWTYNNVGFNLTASYPPTHSTTPIVVDAPLNPYYTPLYPNYLDYIIFTTTPIETNGFYIDTINFDWVRSFPDIPSSNIPSDASWSPKIYFWINNFTFQFDNILATYRNVYNLTIHYNGIQNSLTPIYVSSIYQWRFSSVPYLGLDIPANYNGDVEISNELCALCINKNGSVNLSILHGTVENLPNDISVSMSGYFWIFSF